MLRPPPSGGQACEAHGFEKLSSGAQRCCSPVRTKPSTHCRAFCAGPQSPAPLSVAETTPITTSDSRCQSSDGSLPSSDGNSSIESACVAESEGEGTKRFTCPREYF